MPPPMLVMQTIYAELLDRCSSAAFTESFPQEGAFTSKEVKGRRYWYFQLPSSKGRAQKYVGPETPELLERIARHKEVRDDERERRALVSTLIRSFGLPQPIREIGNVVTALAKAGVFRLRGVLVGTAAYQTYSAMLGTRLPISALQTGDVDITQFSSVSVAIEDRTPPVVEVLKEVDKTFRAIPHIDGEQYITTYGAKGGLRVDFLAPNQGPDTDQPQSLPALQTDAQPLRFLDYLICEPEPAVLLHDSGVFVFVPAPQRYAIHKLIISRRRREGVVKRDKDLQQAESLISIMVEKRPHEIRDAWKEAIQRGPKWRALLSEGAELLEADCRERLAKTVNAK